MAKRRSTKGQTKRTKNSFWLSRGNHFDTHHHDLINRLGISVSQMTTDVISSKVQNVSHGFEKVT
jgi:hypothetical protein